ncbi:MAG: L-aspartate oxidase [bacterium]|nr:L-aspartate oxidase [bacterium]
METDFLVIGSGIAGLTFAIKVSAYGDTAVITKKESTETNTNYAQGGIAAALSSHDSIELHIRDTLNAGNGLCKKEAVRIMANEGPRLVVELSELGVEFTKDKDDNFDLGMEGGHSERRIVHAKDATGAAIETTLVRVAKDKGIKLFDNWLAIDLILKNNRCIGVWVFDVEKGDVFPFFSKATLIATGGIGAIYLHTTNPSIATGDGIAMAYRAGAKIANMEFVQFHPTSFYGKRIGDRALLLSEAIRGEGGILKTKDGHSFMEKYNSRKELAPRDIVARAIHKELKESGDEYVLLDITHIPEKRIKERFPTIYEVCLSFGIDISKEPIPVVPAAHYECGGILIDISGLTNIPCLYAAGESACVGVHGANRLASNSLLESLVFAHRAANAACKSLENVEYPKLHKFAQPEKLCESSIILDYLLQIKRIMWSHVGIVRDDNGLKLARSEVLKYKLEIENLYNTHKLTLPLVELRNVATVASIVIECALWRKESRGLHFNINWPEKDDIHYRKDTIVEKKGNFN